MSRRVSPSTDRVYGLQRVTRIWGVSRATVYRHRHQPEAIERRRPGPLGAMADEELVRAIRRLLQDSPFHGEGYRKLWARLRFAGIRTSRRRVLRLMREHGLLAHQRAGRPHGSRAHDGTITTERVDLDVGHRPDLGDDRRGPGRGVHRRRSLLGRVRRPSRQPQRRSLRGARADPSGVRERFGAFAKDIANGLALRHDHGSQYVSHHFQSEIRFLGIASSPAFVREPEGNGCAERFIRVLKENLLVGPPLRHPRGAAPGAASRSSKPTTRAGSSSGTATEPQPRSEPIRSVRCPWPRKRRSVSQNRGPVQDRSRTRSRRWPRSRSRTGGRCPWWPGSPPAR